MYLPLLKLATLTYWGSVTPVVATSILSAANSIMGQTLYVGHYDIRLDILLTAKQVPCRSILLTRPVAIGVFTTYGSQLFDGSVLTCYTYRSTFVIFVVRQLLKWILLQFGVSRFLDYPTTSRRNCTCKHSWHSTDSISSHDFFILLFVWPLHCIVYSQLQARRKKMKHWQLLWKRDSKWPLLRRWYIWLPYLWRALGGTRL